MVGLTEQGLQYFNKTIVINQKGHVHRVPFLMSEVTFLHDWIAVTDQLTHNTGWNSTVSVSLLRFWNTNEKHKNKY
jgi:hypothetical protein